jgi:hypothetical protein
VSVVAYIAVVVPAAAQLAPDAAAAHAIVHHSACEHPYPTVFHNRLPVFQKLEVGDVSPLDRFALSWIDLDDAKVPGYNKYKRCKKELDFSVRAIKGHVAARCILACTRHNHHYHHSTRSTSQHELTVYMHAEFQNASHLVELAALYMGRQSELRLLKIAAAAGVDELLDVHLELDGHYYCQECVVVDYPLGSFDFFQY